MTKPAPQGDVCSGCLLIARTALLPSLLLDPIVAEVRKERTLAAIRLARETLGWPLRDAAELVDNIKQEAANGDSLSERSRADFERAMAKVPNVAPDEQDRL